MSTKTEIERPEENHEEQEVPMSPLPLRKAYSKPTLEVLGDLRTNTFGSFPGITDSEGQGNEFPF